MGEMMKEAEELSQLIAKVERMGFDPMKIAPIKAEMSRQTWYGLTRIWEDCMNADCDVDIPLTARVRINWFNF